MQVLTYVRKYVGEVIWTLKKFPRKLWNLSDFKCFTGSDVYYQQGAYLNKKLPQKVSKGEHYL